MKNIKLFIGIIIGGIIFGSIGVYAASKIYANQVEIDKTGGKLANVSGTKLQDALDYLYEKASHVGECPEGYTCSVTRNSGYLPENDSTTYTQSTFVQNLKVGDLIKMTPSSESFQTNGNKTGYEPQTLNPQELQYWRVIRKNTNGTVDVVSEYVSSVGINFSGVIGYTYYIGYLNELASHYENSNYTIGSRYMGYSGQTEYIQNPSKFNGLRGGQWTASTSSSTTVEEEALGAGDMGYETDYNLVKDAYKGTTIYGSNSSGTTKAYKVGTTTSAVYWLASRYYYYHSSDSTHFFRGRYATTSIASYDIQGHYTTGWQSANSSAYLRPILTLKADVTSSSVESSTGAYILG